MYIKQVIQRHFGKSLNQTFLLIFFHLNQSHYLQVFYSFPLISLHPKNLMFHSRSPPFLPFPLFFPSFLSFSIPILFKQSLKDNEEWIMKSVCVSHNHDLSMH